MVTPFDDDGALDEEARRRACRVTCSTTAPTGSCGRHAPARRATLTDDEKLRLWELAVAESGDATVIAGTGHQRHRAHASS